jgi:putative transposase
MVDHVGAAWRVSIRRACRAVPVDRSTYHCRSKRAGQAPLAKRIWEIAETRVRCGYRRIHVLLRREGWQVNVNHVCQLYREQGLQLPAGRPSDGSRPSCRKIGRRPPERTRSGPWTSSTTSFSTAGSPGC